MTGLKILLRIPWHLLLFAGVLVMMGSLALYSASQGSWHPWAGRHAVRATIGMALVVGIAFVDFSFIKRMSYVFLAAAILLLLAVMIIGAGQGVSRWISLGGMNLQPSELTKIAVILALARYFGSQSHDRMRSFIWYLPSFAIIGIPFALIMKQPDLGTALMLLFGGLAVVFSAGLPWRYVFSSIAAVLAAVPLLWMQLHAYQKTRVMTFLNPESDLLGAGYQITQSKIALGSGGIFGKGFLMGSQSQLNYLPEKQTDFVFTMIGEEFGFAGNVFILLIYLLLTISILRISYRVKSRFAQLTCVGIGMMVFFYMFVNVAMVTGLLPVVGAPLPLISYGGTSMLTVFIGFGIVASAIVHDRRERAV
ncbi:MAG: rod shape-determining protein RodA [Candidatus Puniceispirillum sp.]|nr:rod shape-determining protein RodA [Candidatus Puniceispirillum sp.]